MCSALCTPFDKVAQKSENISEQLLSIEWSLIDEVHSIKGDWVYKQKMNPLWVGQEKKKLYIKTNP